VKLLQLARREPTPAAGVTDACLRNAVQTMPTAILIFSAAESSIVYANAAAIGMIDHLAAHLPVPSSRLVGSRVEVLHPDLGRILPQLGRTDRLPLNGRLRFGVETVDYLVSASTVAGATEAFMLTLWFSTSQDQVASRFEHEVKTVVERLLGTAGELRTSSREVAGMIEATREETQAVSSAADQLAAAIRDICIQLSRASTVSDKAVAEAQTSDARIGSLAQSASAIGNIVAMIKEIADRTNLLALNATIEAARAGAAGKGFAVVAQEVKTLAGQTAKATADIAAQVTAIQSASGEVVTAIAGIGRVIEEIRGILATISAAVEEQSAATRDASSRIAHVSDLATRSNAAATTLTQAASRVDDSGTALRGAIDRFLEEARRL
jgi:methyl-accepting chemotaxis protein